jgi:hypothetical protein
VSKHPAGHLQRVKSRDRESLRGLGQMGSANPPLAIHCLHDDRRRQLRLYGIREAFGLDSLFTIASSLLNVDHWSVHVRVAVCRQKARVPNRRIGTNTTVTKAKKARVPARYCQDFRGVVTGDARPTKHRHQGDALTPPRARRPPTPRDVVRARNKWTTSPLVAAMAAAIQTPVRRDRPLRRTSEAADCRSDPFRKYGATTG